MGTVTSATILGKDVLGARVDDIEAGVTHGGAGLIELHYAYGPSLIPADHLVSRGIWRYRDLLPLGDGAISYPLAVGDTPLIASPRMGASVGMPYLWLKDETRSPTGSNKDRATALVVEHAIRRGVRTVSCASTGNVAVSLAVGAAAAGLAAMIFVPADVDDTKLSLMLMTGATVFKVAEGYGAAFALSRQAARAFGWQDRNTGVSPLTFEGKKTVAFEIWEQLGRRVPNAVVVPVGDGPTLCGMAKGFRELMACGATDGMPRIIGVQAEGCQPLKRAWDTGGPVLWTTPRTLADGIAVGAPICASMVLRDVRESGGGFVAVSDDSMLEAMSLLSSCGILAEPAGAAAFAGLTPALAVELIHENEEVVVLVTGTALKTPRHLHPQTSPSEIHANLDELQRALDSTAQRTRREVPAVKASRPAPSARRFFL